MNKFNKHNTFETKEKQVEHDRFVAISILRALVDSTFNNELQYYWTPIQEHLNLSDEDMTRLFDLKTIVNLLTPSETYKRYFHGKRVETWVKNQTPVSEEKHTINIALNAPKKNGRKRQRLVKSPSAIIDTPEIDDNSPKLLKTLTTLPIDSKTGKVYTSLTTLPENNSKTLKPKKLFFANTKYDTENKKGLIKLVNETFEEPFVSEKVVVKEDKQFEELLNSEDNVKEESIEEKESEDEASDKEEEINTKKESDNEVTDNKESDDEEATDKEDKEVETKSKKKEDIIVKKLKALMVQNGCTDEELNKCTFEVDNKRYINSVFIKSESKDCNFPNELKAKYKQKRWVISKRKINKQYKQYLSKQTTKAKQTIEIAEKKNEKEE